MEKTKFKKLQPFIAMVLTFVLTLSCFFVIGNMIEPSVFLRIQMHEYEKNKSNEALAATLCYALNESNIEVINKYAQAFLFTDTEKERQALKDVFIDNCRELNEDSTDALYDVVIWAYMYSCVLDYDTLDVKPYSEIKTVVEENFSKCFHLLNIDNNNNQSDIAIATMKHFGIVDKFPEKFIGIINLFSVNKSESLSEQIYSYLWGIASKLDIIPEKDFYVGIISNVKYYDDISIKNPMGNGILEKKYSTETLMSMMDSFAESETTDYNDTIEFFSTLPKEYSNGSYYSFHYYTEKHTVSFYGSPIHSMAISESDTGCIIYSKVKLPSSDGGLKWVVKWYDTGDTGSVAWESKKGA